MPKIHRPRTLRHRLQDIQQKYDLALLGVVLALVVVGLIMVYDSSVIQAFNNYGDKYHYIKQQLIWIVLGFISLGFFSRFDYHHLKRLAVPVFWFSILLLLIATIPGLGSSGGGAQRWLSVAHITIQPSEIIKLTGVIFFAALFEKKVRTLPFLGYAGVILIIIGLLQKDLGTAIVFFFISLTLYIVSGAPVKKFLYLVPVSLLGFILFIETSSYRLNRIKAFIDPFADPTGYTYHISQVLIALGSGGLFGVGLGRSLQKYGYVPEVTTDSIFSIFGEEFGFIGGIILISLFGFLIVRGLRIAQNCEDEYGQLLAFGLIAWLGIQIVVNLAAMVSLIPLTGVPLPFISYGGSALLANLVAIGILLNISKNSNA